MQGDLLAMVAYGIDILPLIKQLEPEFPDVTQTWYADDAGALGTFANFKLYFNSTKRLSLGRSYYPKPSKNFLIVYLDTLDAGKQFGLRHRFKV